MFVVILRYTKPIEMIEHHLDDHKRWLDEKYRDKKFLFSGPRKPRVGGVILANVDTEEEMKGLISEDPFSRAGIAEYELVEFLPTKCIPEFGEVIDL